jgi:Holliday junction resolvase RusA-like endonuclease
MTTPTSSLVAGFLEMVQGFVTGPLLTLWVGAEPAPESLRFAMNRCYPGKNYGIFYRACQQQLSIQKVAQGVLKGPIVAVYEFIHARPKKPANPWPVGDVDNLMKGPQDAVTKTGIWDDDKSVNAAMVVKRYAQPGEEPGVRIHIGKLKEPA